MRRLSLLLVLLLAATCLMRAQSTGGWMERVAATQAEQPHWITPLATTTPRLEQEVRYDFAWLQTPAGTTTNFGFGKGLELIPARRWELIVAIPPYLAHTQPAVPDGWGDWSWLVKYRIFARNEEHGSAIVTAFLGGTVPSGTNHNGAEHATLAPTLAYGKGFGDFDVQGTFGASFPVADTTRLGTPIAWNNAFQYRILKRIWPELEVNTTFFPNGPHDGETQVFLTPGVVFGKFPIHRRIGLTFGAGLQIAATHFHTTDHNAILSLRIPF